MEHLKSFQVFVALLGLAAAQNLTHSVELPASYLLLLPRVLQAGHPTSLSVSILTSSAVTVMARIVHADQEMATQTLDVGGGSTQLLTLPPVSVDKSSFRQACILEVTGYAGRQHVFANKTRLYFEPRGCMTFIHTDKDVYRAGQLVRIRVVTLQDAMKPCNSSLDILVKDPRGNLLRQWRAAQAVLGVLSREFRLSEEPPLGQWTISALVDGDATRKHVHVDRYAMPKFQVTMDLPDVLHWEDTLWGTITARYKYGQPVRGHINITVLDHYYGIEEIYDEHRQIDGSVDFNFTLPDIYARSGSGSSARMYDEQQFLKVVAHVTERQTGVTVDAEARVCLVEHMYKIEFTDYPKILKPSMSFTATVHVCKSNKQPLSDEDTKKTLRVYVVQQVQTPRDKWTRTTHNESGPWHPSPDEMASQDMEFPIPADGVVFIHFLLVNHTRVLTVDASVEDCYQTLQLYSTYKSPSHSYVQIQSGSDAAEVGFPFMLYVDATFPVTGIHYVVKSGGVIVSAGKGSRQLTLVPEASWTPMISVVVFLVREDGEVVNDVVCLAVHPFLRNQVSVSWSEPESRPGSEVTLRVSAAEAGSLVGILVQDKVRRWNEPHLDITKEMMALRGKDKHQYPEHRGMGDPLSVFTSCQLIVLTDASLHATDPWVAAKQEEDSFLSQDEEHRWESVDCPTETWIWTETFTDDSRSAELRVTVPDSITTWTATAFVMSNTLGLGVVRKPAQLSVSKELLLSVHLPPVVTRGEEIVLEVLLFNNRYDDLQVMVLVVQNDTFEFILPDISQLAAPSARRVSLGGKSAASVLFPIRPLVLGDVSVTVMSKSYVGVDVTRGSFLVKAEGLEQSFSTSLLLDVSFRLSNVMTFMFPDGVVAGSRSAWVTLVGDILGPSIQGLGSLIQMPFGCGEQNMIHFAPNIYVLLYLNATGQDHQEVRDMAVTYMVSGYERELSYQRADGSFSAFGERDHSGSTWLTAFVLRCFLQARPFISIDEHVVRGAASWLRGRQGADGVYEEPGRVIHTELQGGLDGPVSLTAYVLIALLEDPNIRTQYASQVAAALMFLETRLVTGHVHTNYSLSLVSYVLAIDGSPNAHTALDQLIGRADMMDGVPTWTSPAAGLASSWQPSSADIETASYALLSLHKLGRLAEGVGLAKWLGRQRNPAGGFGSTQDTVVALQALSTVAVLFHHHDVNLSVSVNDSVFHVNAYNRRLLQTQRVELKDQIYLQVAAEGQGLALLQLNVMYNVRTDEPSRRRRDADSHEAFDVHVRLFDEGQDSRAHLDVCCNLTRGPNATGMALAEVGLLSGFSLRPDAVRLDDVVKKVEAQPGKVVVYLDSITTEAVCVRLPLLVEFKVGKVREAVVLVYDYYEPRRRSVRTYGPGWRGDVDSCLFCGDGCRQCTSDNDWIEASSAFSFRLRPLHALALLVFMTTMHQL
ncbi:CD109 antigen isoform X1 [Phyllopteryx taeniolatus]|uniref:CD109 antigen isoform X1 n=1 Tax=Phyllopteryx taeniolatus TaxID=161469 RepID=UPI002AD3176F|nr:CD109 antigen isoform X1 [Phyllopteryx taeniolatus]